MQKLKRRNRIVQKVKFYIPLTKQELILITRSAQRAKISPGDFLKTAVFEKMFLDIVKKDNERLQKEKSFKNKEEN